MNTTPTETRTPEVAEAYRQLKVAYRFTVLRLLISGVSGALFVFGLQSEQPAIVVLSVLMFVGSIAMIWVNKWDTRFARNNVTRAEFYANYDKTAGNA